VIIAKGENVPIILNQCPMIAYIPGLFAIKNRLPALLIKVKACKQYNSLIGKPLV
jgi:hypothetical protein